MCAWAEHIGHAIVPEQLLYSWVWGVRQWVFCIEDPHLALICELPGEIRHPSFMGATLTAGLESAVDTMISLTPLKMIYFFELTRGICPGETESSAFHSQARWCFCHTELIFQDKRLDGNKTSGLSFSTSWDPSCVPKGCFARSHYHRSSFS